MQTIPQNLRETGDTDCVRCDASRNRPTDLRSAWHCLLACLRSSSLARTAHTSVKSVWLPHQRRSYSSGAPDRYTLYYNWLRVYSRGGRHRLAPLPFAEYKSSVNMACSRLCRPRARAFERSPRRSRDTSDFSAWGPSKLISRNKHKYLHKRKSATEYTHHSPIESLRVGKSARRSRDVCPLAQSPSPRPLTLTEACCSRFPVEIYKHLRP